MAWTAARTWVTGEVTTAAQLNEQIRDNENYLKDAVEARTIRVVTTVDFDDGSPVLLLAAPENSIILRVLARVTTAYDAASWATIGDATDNDGFLEDVVLDPEVAGAKGESDDEGGAYLWDTDHKLVKYYTAATNVNLYQNAGASVQGTIRVVIEYIPA